MDADHGACILAIVGSRDCHRNAIDLIAGIIDRHKPIMVISGGAKVNMTNRLRGLVSVDTEAILMAKALGYQTAEIVPANWHWATPGGIKERNMQIANACICLVRIASTTTKTYGSGWTADYAMSIGKNVTRFIIDENGGVTNG